MSTHKIVTASEFAAFADAIDADGPGVPLGDLSTLALEILWTLPANENPAAQATIGAEIARRERKAQVSGASADKL